MNILEQLQPTTRTRVETMQANVGKTLSELSNILGTNDAHQQQLSYTATKRKGTAGVFIEEMITGNRGDTLSEADDGIVEIKSATVKPATRTAPMELAGGNYQMAEAFRIFNFHFGDIQQTPFEQSSLVKKQLMLVAFYTKSPTSNVGDSVFVGFGAIDLTVHHDAMKADYDATQELCRGGHAHLIGSHKATGIQYNKKDGLTKIQPGSFIKTYSSAGTTKPKVYTDGNGNTCSAKGKDFRLFKPEFHATVQVL